jgi:hypothetical protein
MYKRDMKSAQQLVLAGQRTESYHVAMLERPRATEQLAVDCRWLHRTLDSSVRDDPYRMICQHIVRDGSNCVGPFLENIETTCLLWEPNERLVTRRAQIERDRA